jgi:NADH:ubiquinone reductase (H+-translocating)
VLVSRIEQEGKAMNDERTLHYDTLVYALGSVTGTEGIPGVDDHAYTLNNMRDAQQLATRLRQLDRGTVVVSGGGLTGVESAAEIAEQHPQLQVVLLSRQEPGTMMGRRGGRATRTA